jgi:hypothetical protein
MMSLVIEAVIRRFGNMRCTVRMTQQVDPASLQQTHRVFNLTSQTFESDALSPSTFYCPILLRSFVFCIALV